MHNKHKSKSNEFSSHFFIFKIIKISMIHHKKKVIYNIM